MTFLTNQFLPQAKEAVYDFSGGFFLNNPQLSKAMFDTRNKSLFHFDESMLDQYDRLKKENKENNLIIFHLKGQHVDYRTRFPRGRRHFNPEDYDRPELKQKELRVNTFDMQIEIGLGCDIYLPFFKLIPELKFCFGVVDIINKNRNDLTDRYMYRFTQSVDRATSRSIALTFYFE